MCGEMLSAASDLGASRIVGRYVPTRKNMMVADLYERLGFDQVGKAATDGSTTWALDLGGGASIRNDFVEVERA